MPEDETMRVNTMGTFYLMDAARRLGVQTVIMASTYFVLGVGNRISSSPFKVSYLPIDEKHPLRPEDTYSLSKLLAEEILSAFNRAYGIRTVALRLLGVHYPEHARHTFGQTPLMESTATSVTGLVGTTWQYVDARDVAQACRLALEAEGMNGFEAFFLATDTTLLEDTRVVVERLYPELEEMAATLCGKQGIISIEKARAKLGFTPQHSWRTESV